MANGISVHDGESLSKAFFLRFNIPMLSTVIVAAVYWSYYMERKISAVEVGLREEITNLDKSLTGKITSIEIKLATNPPAEYRESVNNRFNMIDRKLDAVTRDLEDIKNRLKGREGN